MILESRSLPGYVQEMSWELFEKRFVNVPVLSIFIVLTLSASGSEFDPFAVITNENEKKKWLLACGSLFPKVSIIDPTVQATLPWHQIVNGAVDAISTHYGVIRHSRRC